jgi:alkanesulfonate monooxygenase SsuD/methylene tetrahydromethanopterin reductase-like flavin-dependent oxidoreductase (luciferase family)
VGTPAQVADALETWVEEADVDGFNFVGRNTFYVDSDDDETGD